MDRDTRAAIHLYSGMIEMEAKTLEDHPEKWDEVISAAVSMIEIVQAAERAVPVRGHRQLQMHLDLIRLGAGTLRDVPADPETIMDRARTIQKLCGRIREYLQEQDEQEKERTRAYYQRN